MMNTILERKTKVSDYFPKDRVPLTLTQGQIQDSSHETDAQTPTPPPEEQGDDRDCVATGNG